MADYRENVVSSVLLNVVQKNKNPNTLSEILPACVEHHIFRLKNTKGLQDVLAQVNSDLNTAKNRLRGLVVLQNVLGQCSAEVFSANFHTWLNLLLQPLQGYASPEQQQMALHLLSTLIQKVTAFPELSREMGTTKVKMILPVLLSLTSKKTKELVVACLSGCIVHFPGPTSFFKGKIETFLVEELDTASPSQVYVRCYALLARCGTGSHREKHRDAWNAQYEKIVSALKATVTKLYEGLESGEDGGDDNLFLCPEPNVQPARTMCLARRFSTLCACLAALIREPFPCWVPLCAGEILQLVCRTLAVQMDTLVKRGSTDHLLLLTYLPLMYSSVITLLTHLIVCGKRLLVPNGRMLMSLCMQCLASTHLHRSASTLLPFRKVRQCVYQALSTWLQVAGPSAVTTVNSTEVIPLDLLTEIFSDIAPLQPEAVQLGTSEQKMAMQAPPKKKRRKTHVHQELTANAYVFLPDSEDLVCAALKVLRQVFTTVAIFMDENTFSALTTRVCSVAREMQQGAPPPYNVPRCRQALYEALKAAVSEPRPHPLILQHAITLFQRGSQDTQLMVAATCREAMVVCQNLIHPHVPCLLAPVTKPADPSSSSPSPATPLTIPAPGTGLGVATPTSTTTTTNNTAEGSSSAADRAIRPDSTVADPKTTVSVPFHSSRARVSAVPRGSASREPSPPVQSSSNGPQDTSSPPRISPSSTTSRSVPEPSQLDRVVRGSVSESSEGSDDSGEGSPCVQVCEEGAGTSVDIADGDDDDDKVVEESVMETEMNTDVSAMMSSFVPCEADPDEDNSDSD
ncbi:proline-, glutamic acid- and leucine-rich protein 1-like [Babylonia areolata]|uniref:proline-, glutamic acid- and leucine-rich protein 1-like n=1 Tax=Babylonia areolata TaxID=304850 RepID=UPI003FD1A773